MLVLVLVLVLVLCEAVLAIEVIVKNRVNRSIVEHEHGGKRLSSSTWSFAEFQNRPRS